MSPFLAPSPEAGGALLGPFSLSIFHSISLVRRIRSHCTDRLIRLHCLAIKGSFSSVCRYRQGPLAGSSDSGTRSSPQNVVGLPLRVIRSEGNRDERVEREVYSANLRGLYIIRAPFLRGFSVIGDLAEEQVHDTPPRC